MYTVVLCGGELSNMDLRVATRKADLKQVLGSSLAFNLVVLSLTPVLLNKC